MFFQYLPIILEFEGGYSNHPNDKGGSTNKGITQRVYDSYRQKNNLSLQSVQFISNMEISDIYYNEYWLKGKCDKMPDKIKLIHFDSCVNCGIKQSAKFLQRCLNVKDDGDIGQITLTALNNLKSYDTLCMDYMDKRYNFYIDIVVKNPSQLVFLKGWFNRCRQIEKIITITHN